tara:strand:- start:345 stop:740 length:396 start_codon:yes stop_codon:yes gene_type:complete
MAFGTDVDAAAASTTTLSKVASLWDGLRWHICTELLIGKLMQGMGRAASTVLAAEIIWPHWKALLRSIVARSWIDSREQARQMLSAVLRAVTLWRQIARHRAKRAAAKLVRWSDRGLAAALAAARWASWSR